MTTCPVCGTKIATDRALQVTLKLLTGKQRRVYDAVRGVGADGISPQRLAAAMYKNKLPPSGGNVQLRVQIYELNKALEPHRRRVKGYRSVGYRLINPHLPP